MNVVCLLGSPRTKSNSSAIAQRFLKKAEELGARNRVFALNGMKFRGCQGCYACKTKSEACVLKDDFAEVLGAVQDADVIVLATPVYYGDVSGQLKCFIDRTFSYLKPDYHSISQPSRLAPGKKLVFIITQGHPDEKKFSDVFPRYDAFFKWYGIAESRLIRACGVGPATGDGVPEPVLRQAEETAKEILASATPRKEKAGSGRTATRR